MDPDDRGYHPEHSWAKAEDDLVRIGITDHAQAELDTVVYVDRPEPGTHLEADGTFGEIESTKTVSDLIAPLAGTVSARTRRWPTTPSLSTATPTATAG